MPSTTLKRLQFFFLNQKFVEFIIIWLMHMSFFRGKDFNHLIRIDKMLPKLPIDKGKWIYHIKGDSYLNRLLVAF